ncbi:protein OPAQUE10-like [Olea europaea var. sylvestris]|uniref:protein OPAQUE10-like n=1 Tax=Olea europaea var. sylvestris TaxID=158386 RepID=UPI000C1CE1BF|nr:protein OPAQUE10-like [Olea europaea var. sylvestris]
MGRRAVAAVTADSSPSSGESSFRELDDVFLQTQTRIWLGEVLNTRLDEDLYISDLLQDGELLFEISKVIWNLMLAKCVELRHFKHKHGPFGSKKSIGRYRPYSNVDLFLKMCKILGLNGIDLFSPSDVVEKRDIRKVCICIRALSRKARAKQLSVPDFDVVMYTVAMPTDMVGGIRRSLESAQCSLSSSSSYSSHKGSTTKLKQKNLYALSDRNDDCLSEESDEAESRYMEEQSFSSSATKFDATGELHPDLESSPPGAYPEVGRYVERPNVLNSDIKCPYMEEFEHGPHALACSFKPKKLLSSEIFGNDRLLDMRPSNCTKNDKVDISDINFALENDDSVVGDSSSISGDGRNYISDYLAFSDLIVHTTDGSSPLFFDGENNLFDFFLNVDSEELTSEKRCAQNGLQRKYSDDEDMEVSSTTSMSSVLGRLLNMEFADQFDADDSSTTNVYVDDSSSTNVNIDNSPTTNYSSGSMDIEADKKGGKSFVLYETQNMDKFGNPPRTSASNSPEPEFIHKNLGVSTEYLSSSQHNCQLSSHDDDTCYASENRNQDKKEHSMEVLAENTSDGNKNTSPELPPVKHGRKQLLKTVFKGTALVGVLFFLLHIRSRGDNAKETKPFDQTQKFSSSKFSSTKQRKEGRMSGIYPADKLKFGN